MTDDVEKCNQAIEFRGVAWHRPAGRSCCRVDLLAREHAPVALSNNRSHRIITFSALYFAQGIPWGFMAVTLPAFLVTKYDVGESEIGHLKAVILWPWSLKLIWAPIMDTFTFRRMGRRRPWILGAELLMSVTLLGMLGIEDLPGNIDLLVWMYVIHNIFTSLQDVCTDAMAVDLLPPDEQGKMNGLMWGAKMVGRAAGMTGLAFVLEDYGLDACIAIQAVLLLFIMLVPLLILERPGEWIFPWRGSRWAQRNQSSADSEEISAAELQVEKQDNIRNPRSLMADLKRAFSLTPLWVFVIFTLTKLLGVGVNETITLTLFTKRLGWEHTDFSMASGMYALPVVILAAVFGGFLADRFGRRTILIVGFGGFAMVAFLFGSLPHLWHDRAFTTAYVLAYEGLNVVGSVGFLALAMRITWTQSAGTVFTTYMTLSNVSHVLGDELAGPLRSGFYQQFVNIGSIADPITLSYQATFWDVGALSLVPLLLLYWVRSDKVDAAKAQLEAEKGEGPSEKGLSEPEQGKIIG